MSGALRWTPRDEPLPPRGIAACGDAARRLVARLLALPDDALGRLAGVHGAQLIVALGEEDALPWVDGAVYLGRTPAAPALYLPTALDPGVNAALLERALVRRFEAPPGSGGAAHAEPPAGLAPPLALLPERGQVASLASARPIDRARLLAIPWR